MTGHESVPESTSPEGTEAASTAEAKRLSAAKTMFGLCLDAHQGLPVASVTEGDDGVSIVRTWVVNRLQALAYNCPPTWLETAVPPRGSEAAVVSKLGLNEMSTDPVVTLAMQPTGVVETVAELNQIEGYAALLQLRLLQG